MATHKIGNFKFNLSKRGLAWKMGEGDIHRLPFGKQPEPQDDPYAPDEGDDSDYAYNDGGEGDYYENSAQDDGYYTDSGDPAPDEGYEDDDGYYGQERQAGPVMEYVENNIWVVIALLVLLPPLGIYLLWRLGRFDFKLRVGISAVSAAWFIAMLIFLFSSIFGGGSDTSALPEMKLTTIAPTVETSLEATQEALNFGDTATGEATIAPDVSAETTAAATNIIDNGGSAGATYVYSPQTGLYYHTDAGCSKITAADKVTLVTLEAAQNRNQTACPVCGGVTIYYARADGKYYHTDSSCTGMKNAVEYSKEAAEAEGKTACPVCAGGTEKKDTDNRTPAQKYADSITNDKSGLKVWMTANGTWFHTNSSCQGMSNAREVSLLKALQAGKTGCPVCASGANKIVYCTSSGTWYHTDSNCTGMSGAKGITLAAAMVLGKKKCPTCVTEDFYSATATPAPENAGRSDNGDVYVYATANGRYYHTNSTCSDMTNASKVTLLSMIKEGRPACPICCSSAKKTVYVAEGGRYYHSYATCSGMTNAKAGTLAQALAYGYTACSKCWSGGEPSNTPAPTAAATAAPGDNGNNGYSDVYVYATENGKYYHTKSSCSDIESGATKVLLELAIDDGKRACPKCASNADDKVYAQKGGKYYHKNSTCSGMTNASSGTLVQALLHGYTACPVCFGTNKNDNGGKGKFTSGTSGIDVYATSSGKYYHTLKTCSSISGTPVKVTLEVALNNNKSACPVCAESARRTVYATKGGKYYHYSSSCAGSSASAGTLDEALAYGLKACPNCVTGIGDNGGEDKKKFVSGTSGIKVYAVPSGKYFHTNSTCGGMKNASYITLENALNYGLTACPDCAAAAGKKVYAVSGGSTYHYDASCAGPGAVSGTMAEALAYGMKACGVCVNNDGGGDNGGGDNGDGEDNSAPGDTLVYIDLSGDTSAYLYHGASSCSDCGMKNGTAVTLKYALNHGFSDCGYCNPPSSISEAAQ